MALAERSSDLTIASILAERAAADSAAPFLFYGDSSLPYAQVEEHAGALAASLVNLGIGAGDRVALVLPPWPEFAIATFAAAKLGAVIVPLNPRLTVPELRYMLRHSESVCAISAEQVYGIDYLHLFEDLLVELPELQYLVTVGEEDLWYDDRVFQWEDLVSAGRGRPLPPAPDDPDETFAILYTSGTTGKPKGVELSHRNLVHAAGETARAAGLEPEDRVVGVTALFHTFGLGPGLLGTLTAGAGLVLQDEFGAAETLALVERHHATVHYGVPTLFATELKELEVSEVAIDSVRVCLVSGAPVRDELARRIEEQFGAPLLIAYSLTEAASTVAISRADDPDDKRRFTVGRPIGETDVRITDEEGVALPVESVGEIGVRGPGVMLGYYRQPKETAAVRDSEGFLRTGDLGMLDEDGYLHLVGRRKDVVMRSGFSVYPGEVEDRLAAHPAVDRVAVVGVPDLVLGEAICACVVPVEGALVTEEELRSWSQTTLAEYKLPDSVRFMDDLPLTGTGKVWRLGLARLVSQDQPSRLAEGSS